MPHYGIKFCGSSISNLRYANDSDLIESTEECIKRLTHDVNVGGNNQNLHLNVKITKLLVAGKNPGTNHNILIDGEEVDEMEKFRYLGSVKTCTTN